MSLIERSGGGQPASVTAEPGRRLTFAFLLGAVAVEVMFFVMLGPLLPHYATALHLSRSGAGVLSGSYAVGCGVAAIPAGVLVSRGDPRAATVVGLVLVGMACLVFAFGSDALELDGARLAQGIGGAALWAGTMSWLIGLAGTSGRGRLIGSAFSAAGAGACVGPALGVLANAVGTRPVFVVLGTMILALAGAGVWLARLPPPPSEPVSLGPRAAIRVPATRAALAVVALPSVAVGVCSVLLPLRLHALGMTATVIGGAYVVSALLEVIVNPLVGRWYDGPGRDRVLRTALALSVAFAVALGLPLTGALLVVALTVSLPVFGAIWVPGLTELTSAVERAGGGVGLALGLFNFGWAVCQAAGAIAGPQLARTGEAVPFLALAALFALGLAGRGLWGALTGTAIRP